MECFLIKFKEPSNNKKWFENFHLINFLLIQIIIALFLNLFLVLLSEWCNQLAFYGNYFDFGYLAVKNNATLPLKKSFVKCAQIFNGVVVIPILRKNYNVHLLQWICAKETGEAQIINDSLVYLLRCFIDVYLHV